MKQLEQRIKRTYLTPGIPTEDKSFKICKEMSNKRALGPDGILNKAVKAAVYSYEKMEAVAFVFVTKEKQTT